MTRLSIWSLPAPCRDATPDAIAASPGNAFIGLFAVTFIAAVVHSIGSYIFTVPEDWKKALLIISITFPAIGAALHGYVAQRQFRRNSERYRTMAGVLAQVRIDMSEATELKEVQEVARETERVMREENSDWFGVMRFHDIELIT